MAGWITQVTSDQFARTPHRCPAGSPVTAIDIKGNFLNYVDNSFQTNGVTPGVVLKNPAGSSMITLSSRSQQRIGSAAKNLDVGSNGATTISRNASVAGSLRLTGESTLIGNLNVAGTATSTGALNVHRVIMYSRLRPLLGPMPVQSWRHVLPQ